MLRVAIDASRTTVSRVTGTEHYAIQLLRGILRLNQQPQHQHQFTLYFRDAPVSTLFPLPSSLSSANYVQQVIPFRRMWTHVRFAAALWQTRPDVTFVPAHTLPFIFPGRAVVTVHDLGFKLFPQAHPPRDRRYLDWTTRYSARRARLILADSQATADDLTRFYGTPPEKIRVVYPGVEITPPTPDDLQRVQTKLSLPPRYFLFIGTLQPRKNIARIVQAYRQYRTLTGDDAELILAGGKGWLYDPTWCEGVAGVRLLGYVDDADKPALYGGALALVFPTLYEGFGFPVVEAMLCHTPVIASTTSSLPELVGEAGLLVDPLNVDAIAAAMQRLTTDAALRAKLRELGMTQARKFTWEAAAKQALNTLEAAALG